MGSNDSNMIDQLAILKEKARKVDAAMQSDLNSLKPSTDNLLMEVLEYGLLNGGKRVRPILAATAARLCGNQTDQVYQLGIAFEYLHGATLFHDDIIDQSETRRGKACIHKKFGMVEAILAGDFLHAHSMSIIGELTGKPGLAVFCKATKGMVDGEFMQLHNAQNYNLSELDYYDAIMGKTGVLIAAACEIGGIYGGASEEQLKALRSYGENLGCAFQIVDDLLDYQGNPEVTGKSVGNDLIEGKMTLPFILALSKANDTDRQRLYAILADKKLRQTCFIEVQQIISKYEGFLDAKKKAGNAISIALENLDHFPSPETAASRMLLEALAKYVISREK